MKKITFILSLLGTLALLTSSCKQTQETHKSLENAIITTIKAYQDKDEKTLNELILNDFGIAFIYIPGAIPVFSISDTISFEKPVPDYFPFESLITADYNIRFEELPYYDCGEDKWNKPYGIYCDTINTSQQLSTIAKMLNLDFEGNFSDAEITKLEEIEQISHKIIVLDPEGNYFKFYLTCKNDKWYLTIIDRTDYCSA